MKDVTADAGTRLARAEQQIAELGHALGAETSARLAAQQTIAVRIAIVEYQLAEIRRARDEFRSRVWEAVRGALLWAVISAGHRLAPSRTGPAVALAW